MGKSKIRISEKIRNVNKDNKIELTGADKFYFPPPPKTVLNTYNDKDIQENEENKI